MASKKTSHERFHLSVNAQGVVSLWDTERLARSVKGEEYVELLLTPTQKWQLHEAQREATVNNTVFREGDRVHLAAYENDPPQRGRVTSDGVLRGVIQVRLDEKYWVDDSDDGYRDIPVEQVTKHIRRRS